MSRPVCVVTGGTSGVGLSTALLFAGQGFDIVTCGRDAERIEKSRESVEGQGVECLVLSFDLDANATSAAEIVDAAMEKFGRVDLLVNNAAVAPLSDFGNLNSDEFETAINVNHRSVFYLTQAAWRQMLKSGAGCIINISSLAAVDPFPGFSIYGSSKAWIDLFTLALSNEEKNKEFELTRFDPAPWKRLCCDRCFRIFLPTKQFRLIWSLIKFGSCGRIRRAVIPDKRLRFPTRTIMNNLGTLQF